MCAVQPSFCSELAEKSYENHFITFAHSLIIVCVKHQETDFDCGTLRLAVRVNFF